jgi:hypothetical protein
MEGLTDNIVSVEMELDSLASRAWVFDAQATWERMERAPPLDVGRAWGSVPHLLDYWIDASP